MFFLIQLETFSFQKLKIPTIVIYKPEIQPGAGLLTAVARQKYIGA